MLWRGPQRRLICSSVFPCLCSQEYLKERQENDREQTRFRAENNEHYSSKVFVNSRNDGEIERDKNHR
jgi:hypothetical protein